VEDKVRGHKIAGADSKVGLGWYLESWAIEKHRVFVIPQGKAENRHILELLTAKDAKTSGEFQGGEERVAASAHWR
jgi:hypothetical protein